MGPGLNPHLLTFSPGLLLTRSRPHRPLSSFQASSSFPRSSGGIWFGCVRTGCWDSNCPLPFPRPGQPSTLLLQCLEVGAGWPPGVLVWCQCHWCSMGRRRYLELGRGNQTTSAECCPREGGWTEGPGAVRDRGGSFCHQSHVDNVRRRNRSRARGLHPCVHFTRHHFLGISHELGLLLGPGDADSLCPQWVTESRT